MTEVRPLCQEVRETLSARLDGEHEPLGAPLVSQHLQGCTGCAAYASHIASTHRQFRVRPAMPVPDLSNSILEAAVNPGRSRISPARYALLVAALVELALALPALVGTTTGGSHAVRELRSWDVAFAVGLLVVAQHPRYARSLLPMACALAALIAISSILSIGRGEVPAAAEAAHFVELMGFVALVLVDRSARNGASNLPLIAFNRSANHA